MDYKLAKQLKDAGFPIKEFIYDEKNYVINITLSELIEACGDDFYYLGKVITKDGIFWEAFDTGGDSGGRKRTMKTAVAKLWLKLNK